MIVASVGTALPDQKAANQALIAFVCIYIFFFACSWGPCAWVVTGEIFPLKARAKGLSMTTASNWLLNWAIAYSTPYMVNPGKGNANLGSKVFFICTFTYVYRYPEMQWLTLIRGRLLLDLLCLRIPLHLRNKRLVSRTSRRALRQGVLSPQVSRLCSDRQLH
jgi:hypothetical protein